MDEADLRWTLNALAGAPEPPARFDLGRAMDRGRRDRRVRQATIWGSALAAGAAVVVAIVLGVVLRPAALRVVPGDQRPACPALPVTAPTASPRLTPDPAGTGAPLSIPPVPLTPLAPCVSFGWLPPGYTADTRANGDYSQAEPQTLSLDAENAANRDHPVQLYVNAAGACTESSQVVNCGWLGMIGDITLTHPAPPVGGQPAYWTPNCGLLWRYAPGSWAIVRNVCLPQSSPPPPSVRSLLLREAAGVRFADSAPLVFPFRLDGVPSDWQVSLTRFAQAAGKRYGYALWFGPASASRRFLLTIIPASDTASVSGNIDQACGGGGLWSPGRAVRVHGAPATVWTMDQRGFHDQRLCAQDVDGYAIWADANAGSSVPARFRSVTALVDALHLLSTDPADWTSHPLRLRPPEPDMFRS